MVVHQRTQNSFYVTSQFLFNNAEQLATGNIHTTKTNMPHTDPTTALKITCYLIQSNALRQLQNRSSLLSAERRERFFSDKRRERFFSDKRRERFEAGKTTTEALEEDVFFFGGPASSLSAKFLSEERSCGLFARSLTFDIKSSLR